MDLRLSTALSEILDTLVPRDCVYCGALSSAPLCPGCASELPTGLWPLVLPIPGARSVRAWAPYDGPAGAALKRGKYGRDPDAIRALAARLARACAAPAGDIAPPDRVVPAPQPLTTTFRRGFSPAWLLARAVAEARSAPLEQALSRSGGPQQASLPPALRRASELRGRVRARGPVDGVIWLVDDVVTTGRTASACARALLDAGARQVHVIALTSPLL
jgi:predicted amidophosphoribosyltransferase